MLLSIQPMESKSGEGWKQEKESLNLAVTYLFIYASIFGILIYTVFDFYSAHENVLIFIKLRVAVSLSGFILLLLQKRNRFKIVSFQRINRKTQG